MNKIDILVSGTFQHVHSDHIKLIEYAASMGTVTVAINGDRYQKKKYGSKAIPARYRLRVMEVIRGVSRVLVFEEDDPREVILQGRPRAYVKGPDYRDQLLPEDAALLEVGCQLLIRPGERLMSNSCSRTTDQSAAPSPLPQQAPS